LFLEGTKFTVDLFSGEEANGTKASVEDIFELLIRKALTAILLLG